MPNFIVPVVGNPNGGFQNGDQVTAENLNAHVQEAIPIGAFIGGRVESQTVAELDYFLKLGEDGNLYKVKGSSVASFAGSKAEYIKVREISGYTGDGSTVPFSSISFNKTNNLFLWLNAWSDTSNNSGGNFQVTANSHTFTYNQTGVFGVSNNLFKVGTANNRSWFDCNSYIWAVDSTFVPEFKGTHALRIPVGGNTQRPGVGNNPNAAVGQIRFNSDINDVEFLGNNSVWYGLRSTAASVYPRYEQISQISEGLSNGGQWYSKQWGGGLTIDHKQVEIFIPECNIYTWNGDNQGWMWGKIEIIARKESEVNEFVIAQYHITGNGNIFGGGRYLGGTWYLSPSNLDLRGMTLYLRFTTRSGWVGDGYGTYGFTSHLAYRPVVLDGNPIPTGYGSRSQLKVNNHEGSRTEVWGGAYAMWTKYPSSSQY